jgi:transcriptional regulator NrdR family protein
MKCPHCKAEGKSKVLESRPHDGRIWRRRMCPLCFKTYVSSEHAEPEMKMPPETQSKYRITDPKPKPEQGDGIIRSTGDHLKWMW